METTGMGCILGLYIHCKLFFALGSMDFRFRVWASAAVRVQPEDTEHSGLGYIASCVFRSLGT